MPRKAKLVAAAAETPRGPLTPMEREQRRFKQEAERYKKSVNQIVMTILVWGPGLSHTDPAAQTRRDLHEKLRKRNFNALFSEDILRETGNGTFSLVMEEMAHAYAAHFIFIIVGDISNAPGALAETHDFFMFVNKLYVFCPERLKHGYSGLGTLKELDDAYNRVYWYTDDDLVLTTDADNITWNTIQESAIKKAQALRELEARRRVAAGKRIS